MRVEIVRRSPAVGPRLDRLYRKPRSGVCRRLLRSRATQTMDGALHDRTMGRGEPDAFGVVFWKRKRPYRTQARCRGTGRSRWSRALWHASEDIGGPAPRWVASPPAHQARNRRIRPVPHGDRCNDAAPGATRRAAFREGPQSAIYRGAVGEFTASNGSVHAAEGGSSPRPAGNRSLTRHRLLRRTPLLRALISRLAQGKTPAGADGVAIVVDVGEDGESAVVGFEKRSKA